MNILYISHLDGRPWAGPTYSVPNQIKAQTKYDNVFWFNFYTRNHPEWTSSSWKELPYYCDLIDYPSGNIHDLPSPFNKPDLIILEQFYCFAKTSVPRQLMRRSIPYVIVPRGELTEAAQKRKFLKKRLFNALYYNQFARKASAIQFLTDQEKTDSTEKWNDESLIVPNGVTLPQKIKTSFSKDSINAVVIGRIEPYQKGLDLLIEACKGCKEIILNAGLQINIYGPDRVGRLGEIQALTRESGLENVISFYDGIYGDEKERVLLGSDVFIIPSRFEGHPTALIEALSYGIPALVTTGANMRKEIENFDAGWGADVTSDSIKNTIINMINERGLFKEKGEHARLLANSYAWDSLAKDSHEKYLKLLKMV